MKNLGLFLLLFSTLAVGSGVVQKYYTDQMQLGVATSGDDKEIIVNTGDGALNPKLVVDGTTKEFSFSKALSVLENFFTVGDGTTADKKVLFNKGAGASNPFIGYDSTADALVFSNDGTLVKKIGSGSGTGSGINIMENEGFEDGVDSNWNYTPGRVTESLAPLIGEKSASFDPVNQNEFFESSLKTIPAGLHGNACQAEFSWKGGDENYTIELIDGNATVLDSRVLSARATFSPESFFFLCPNDTEMAGDSNLGTYKLRIYQHTLVDATAIELDSMYIGTLKGLSETVLPDVFSAIFLDDGTKVSGSDIFGDCTKVSTGNYSCPMVGLSEMPSCAPSFKAIAGSDGKITYQTNNSSNTTAFFVIGATSGAGIDREFNLVCQKQGADAKQSVQVYKAIPKVNDNLNEFTASFNASGTLTRSNTNWVSCTIQSTGNFLCDYSSLGLTQTPSILGTIDNAGAAQNNDWSITYNSISATSVLMIVRVSETYVNRGFSLLLQKNGADFITGKTQNISLAGITVNSYAEANQKQVRVENCEISSSGSISTINQCDSWVDSITVNSLGYNTVNFKTGIWGGDGLNYACSCTAVGNYTSGGTYGTCNSFDRSSTSMSYETRVTVGGSASLAGAYVTIQCIGEK